MNLNKFGFFAWAASFALNLVLAVAICWADTGATMGLGVGVGLMISLSFHSALDCAEKVAAESDAAKEAAQ